MASAADDKIDRIERPDTSMVDVKGFDFASLAKSVGGSLKAPAPVHRWDPPSCGDIGLEILKDGVWRYQGSPIGRQRLVKLFASVLKRDEHGAYWVVTPVEKAPVKVECAPFLAVALDVKHQGETDQAIAFVTNLGDVAEIGPNHPLRVDHNVATGEPLPFVTVRHGPDNGLEALVTRSCFYDLVNLADLDGDMLVVRSAGCAFPLGSVHEAKP